MTKERIEDFREIVFPFMQKRLLEINYENLGESDAEEFTRNFNEILGIGRNTTGFSVETKGFVCCYSAHVATFSSDLFSFAGSFSSGSF